MWCVCVCACVRVCCLSYPSAMCMPQRRGAPAQCQDTLNARVSSLVTTVRRSLTMDLSALVGNPGANRLNTRLPKRRKMIHTRL